MKSDNRQKRRRREDDYEYEREEYRPRRRPEQRPTRRRDYDDYDDYDAFEDRRRPARKKSGCLGCFGCLIPFLVLIIAVVAVGYMAVGYVWGRVTTPQFDNDAIVVNSDLDSSVKGESTRYRSILLFGVDSRDQDPLKTGALADANILVTIDKLSGEITLTSIYRDTLVETTEGTHMKLTEVYSKYGVKEAIQTINRNLDLNVTEFVTVTWDAVATVINQLGGIDITITRKEAKAMNPYIDDIVANTDLSSSHVSEDISENGEKMHLDGVQAVAYCRLRKGLGDDYQRTVRQRTVITASFGKAMSNPASAAKAAYKVLPMIASNISTMELMKMGTGALRYKMGENYGYPNYKSDGAFVYADTLVKNNEWLHETVYGNTSYEASDTVKSIDEYIKSSH